MKDKTKELLNVAGDSTPEEEKQRIDSLIETNEARVKLPHRRARSFAILSLIALYALKGIDAPPDLLKMDSTLPENNDEDKVLNKCWAILLDGNIRDALDSVQDATEKFPYSPEAWFLSAFAKNTLGEFENAISNLEKAIRLKPNESYYHYELGVIYQEHGNLNASGDSLAKALKLAGEVTVYRFTVGRLLVLKKEYSDAIEILEGCVEQEPDIQKYNEALAAAYDFYAISDWEADAKGGSRCSNEKCAQKSIKILQKASKLSHSNTNLKKLIAEDESDAKWALDKHWKRSVFKSLKGAILAIVVGFIAAVVGESIAGTFIGILVFFIICGGWVATGFKPGWKLNAEKTKRIDLKEYNIN